MMCYQFEAGRRPKGRKRDKWEETTNGKVIDKSQSQVDMAKQKEKYESNVTKNQKQRKEKERKKKRKKRERKKNIWKY